MAIKPRNVFTFLRRHQYLEPIVFNDYYDPCKLTLPRTSVIVLDSVNAENNITGEWTEATRTAFLDCVQDAYDAMMDAQQEMDGDEEAAIDHWCRVFGEAFRNLSAEED